MTAITRHIREAWDWVVAYLVPGFVWRPWMRYVYRPMRYGTSPWAKSSCDTCPWCQEIAATRDGESNGA